MNTSESCDQQLSATKHGAALLYVRTLSNLSSKRTMISTLRVLSRLDPRVLDGTLDYASAVKLRSALVERYAPSTANRMLSAVRGVLKAAQHLGIRNDYERMASALYAVKAFKLPRGRAIEQAEIAALVKACDASAAGVRDRAIIGLLYSGLRRSEVASLRREGVKDGRVIVYGKGRRERVVYLPHGVWQALQAWLDIRDRQLPLEGRVFARIRHDGQLIGSLSSQSIYNALSKRAMQADVWHITPHDLRRTFVTRLLERNVDTFIVAKLVGHADPRTTAIYDRRAEQEAKKAIAQLDFP